jgi:thioredoxin reductase (NADPH)
MDKEYELIILGAGPAGLTAGIYAARDKLNTLVIEKAMPGGLAIYADQIDNYPGFPDGIGGMELAELMLKQGVKFGLNVMATEALDLEARGSVKVIRTGDGDFTARAVIIALGSERVNMEVPGEKEFVGRGVSYCATCDAAFFRNQKVAVVGGGNSAISEALHLAKFASEVNIIHRRAQFRATPVFVDKARAESKIKFLLERTVDAVEGQDKVEKLKLNNTATGEKSELSVAGVFVAIGQKPNTEFLKGKVPLDAGGYIITNEKMETSVPGILAAGDIRSNSIRQTISAAGDGATAAIYADRYLGG